MTCLRHSSSLVRKLASSLCGDGRMWSWDGLAAAQLPAGALGQPLHTGISSNLPPSGSSEDRPLTTTRYMGELIHGQMATV